MGSTPTSGTSCQIKGYGDSRGPPETRPSGPTLHIHSIAVPQDLGHVEPIGRPGELPGQVDVPLRRLVALVTHEGLQRVR